MYRVIVIFVFMFCVSSLLAQTGFYDENSKLNYSIYDTISLKNQIQQYDSLYNQNKVNGNVDSALYYIKKTKSLTDSLFNIRKENLINVSITERENQKVKDSIIITIEENAIKENQITLTKEYETFLRLISVGFILIIILIVFMIRLSRKSSILLKNKHEELMLTERALREANASKDKFFSIIAHDLKNPFSTLYSMAILLRDNYDELDIDSKTAVYSTLKKSIDMTCALAENILQWAKTQTNRIEVKKEKIVLKNLASNVFDLVSISADEKQIQLINDFSEDCVIDADRNITYTILRNLISNAVKFTRQNGYVKVWCENNNKKHLIIIEDNGCGISPDDLNKLFRIDVDTSSIGKNTEAKGTGLGLILCYELVKMMGGEIWAESEMGKRTRFFLSFPHS